jgi:diphthine synthase
LGELIFVGLGLDKETDLSLKGLEKVKKADAVFAELYTSLMPELSVQRLERLCAKRITVLSRRNLEDENGEKILREARNGTAVLLVPGDPLIATTHVELRIRAERTGIRTSIIHGSSILSAAIGLSGLQNYKFGRSVTIPFPVEGSVSETPYHAIAENRKAGLHTFCFLDINAEEKRYMTINEGLKILLALESRKDQKVITNRSLSIGVARAGSENPTVKAGFVPDLLEFDFARPPHTLIFVGSLHFMEAEALVVLAQAPALIREMVA